MNQSLPIIVKRRINKASTQIPKFSNSIVSHTINIRGLPKRRNTINNPSIRNISKELMTFSNNFYRKRNDIKRKSFLYKSKIDMTCENIDNDCKKIFRQILTQNNNFEEEKEEENSFDDFKTEVKHLNEEIDKKGFFKVYRTKYKPTVVQKQFISSKPDNIFYKNQIIDNMPSEYVYKFRKELNRNFKLNLPFYSKSKQKDRKIDYQRFNILKKFNQCVVYEKNVAEQFNLKVNKSAVEYLKI